MIKLYEKFSCIDRSKKDTQYPIFVNSVIKTYYGVSSDGFLRIAFLSTKSIGIKGTTKNISVVQGSTSESSYWTCFDLKNDDLLSAFCTFGEDLFSSINNEEDENIAASKLRLRFNIWLALFKKSRMPLSLEKAKGLFGELYFLKNYIMKKYDSLDALNSWSGPDMYSKDFAIDNNWFEIKTIGVYSTVVKISSLQQLSSDSDGHLVVIKVEEMADTFEGEDCSINGVVQDIISKIDDNVLKDLFLEKLSNAGYDFCDDLGDKKYRVAKVESYFVNSKFPALREQDIKSNAVNNVSYELIIALIRDYIENLEEINK